MALEEIDFSSHCFDPNEEFEKVQFSGTLPIGNQIDGLSLVNCSLKRINISSCTFTKFYSSATVSEHLEAVSLKASESVWKRSKLTNSRLTGMQLTEATFHDCEFNGCLLNLALFRFAKLQNVLFKNCILVEADFSSAALKNVSFSGCDLERADFQHATLVKVDLRGANLAGLQGISDLRGATVSSDQLIGLAHELALHVGISVVD